MILTSSIPYLKLYVVVIELMYGFDFEINGPAKKQK
jgi:hypothetical protein